MTSTVSCRLYPDQLKAQHAAILGQCAQVRQPFTDVCHVAFFIPGGVVDDDQLRIDATRQVPARCHPGRRQIYAQRLQHLTVAAGAALEWLPQENIVYQGARVHASTRIDLRCDTCCRPLGKRPGEEFERGENAGWGGEAAYLGMARILVGPGARRALRLRGQPGGMPHPARRRLAARVWSLISHCR